MKPKQTLIYAALLVGLFIIIPQQTNAFVDNQKTFVCRYLSFILQPIGVCSSESVHEIASDAEEEADSRIIKQPEFNALPAIHTTSTIHTLETIYLPGEQLSHTLTAEALQPFLENFALLNQASLFTSGVTEDQLADVLHIARRNNRNTRDNVADTTSGITESGILNNATLTGDIGLSDLSANALLYPNTSGVLTAAVGLSVINNSLLIGTSTPYEKLTVDGPIFLGSETPATTTSRLYNSAGSLYWAGNLVAGAAVGSWTANGGDIYRASGNVGIGTTSPASALDVWGDFRVGTGTTPTLFTDASSGFVGIGTAAPSQGLHVADSGSIVSFFESSDNGRSMLEIQNDTGNDGFIGAASAGLVLSGGAHDSDHMVIDSTGNVGIGTVTPSTKFHVQASGGTDGDIISEASNDTGAYFSARANVTVGSDYYRGFQGLDRSGTRKWFVGQFGMEDDGALGFYTNGTSERMRITSSGNVGIGTTSPSAKLDIAGPATDTVAARSYLRFGNSDGLPFIQFGLDSDGDLAIDNVYGTPSNVMLIKRTGNVGIGTTSPSAQLHTTGSVRFATFGAGTLQTDASGNLSVSSDVRLKDVQGDFNRSIEALLAIEPITYNWNEASGFDRSTLYAGFSAQNIKEHIPEAVGENPNGFLTLSDRPIIATLVNAVQEIWQKLIGHDTRITELEREVSELKSLIGGQTQTAPIGDATATNDNGPEAGAGSGFSDVPVTQDNGGENSTTTTKNSGEENSASTTQFLADSATNSEAVSNYATGSLTAEESNPANDNGELQSPEIVSGAEKPEASLEEEPVEENDIEELVESKYPEEAGSELDEEATPVEEAA